MRLIIWSVVVATFSQSTTAISLPYPKAQEGQQLIANNNEDALRDGIFTAKITDLDHYLYRVTIEVGTPPQPFHAGLDLGWTDAFLPSSKCVAKCPKRPSYNSSESSTYVDVWHYVKIDFINLIASGYSSQDTFHIAGLSIPGQVFAEMTDFEDYSYWDRRQSDYFPLGLSRVPIQSPESTLKATGPWHNMVQQKKLQKNIFSLKLSNSPDQDGEIMFGGVNRDLFKGELMSLPTTNLTVPQTSNVDELIKRGFNSGWQVAAHSVSFGSAHADITGYTAIFSTKYPWIQLPDQLGRAIDREFVDRTLPGYAGVIDCRRRGELPDLIVRLGVEGSATLVISPWDYAEELPERGRNGEAICAPPLWWEFEGDAPEYILLGSLFLRGLYSVFDQDEGTISFAQLKKEKYN